MVGVVLLKLQTVIVIIPIYFNFSKKSNDSNYIHTSLKYSLLLALVALVQKKRNILFI
jgi:hypothetical protein